MLLVAFCLVAACTLHAHAQPAQDFYKGKQVRMIIGHPVGGDYDVGGRLLAKYLPKHIPGNPTVIVQNMPAAGSIVAGNFLYNQAPRTAPCSARSRATSPNQALMGNTRVETDPRRFNYLGATSLPSRSASPGTPPR